TAAPAGPPMPATPPDWRRSTSSQATSPRLRRRSRSRAVYGCGMAHLAVPQPYDFALSTERFRRFGPDLANLWHEGGLHRVVGGRDVRIEAAPGGVDVEPLDEEVAAVVGTLLGLEFDLPAFELFALDADPKLAGLVDQLRGFRPPIGPDPFETLVTSITAQQVSLASAFAIRSRMIERLGEPG